jgi:hypothetical protein
MGLLARVVDDDERQLEGSLEIAEVSQEPGDVLARVLVAGVQAHQGIEDEEAGPQAGDGGPEAQLIPLGVEPHDRLGDDRHVEVIEGDAPVAADGVEAAADLREPILGEVDEGGAWGRDGEPVEGGRAGGDADGEVEAEPALHRFWAAPDHADGFPSPEALDEPAVLGPLRLEVPGEDGGEEIGLVGIHGQRTFRAPTTWVGSTTSAS